MTPSTELAWNDQRRRSTRTLQKRRLDEFDVEEDDHSDAAGSDDDYRPTPKASRFKQEQCSIKREPAASFTSSNYTYVPPAELQIDFPPLLFGAACKVSLGPSFEPPKPEIPPPLGVLHSLAAGIEPSLPPCILEAAKTRNASKKSGSSLLHGVTRHSTTGRWEAHLWDGSFIRPKKGGGGRTRGRQVYLGGWSSEEAAGTAYDLAALWFWQDNAQLNFPLERYAADIPILQELRQDEMVAMLKRHSSGFARGQSRFRGVTRHHQAGRFEARLGRVSGNRYLYLGCFDDEVSAARAYDMAALHHRGVKAVTNFPAAMYGYGLEPPPEMLTDHAPHPEEDVLIDSAASVSGSELMDSLAQPTTPADDQGGNADGWGWAQEGGEPLEGLDALPACSLGPPTGEAISDAQLMDMVSSMLAWEPRSEHISPAALPS